VTVDARHYAIGREISKGGMGRILLANDRRLDRAVAIKEILRDTSGLAKRFEREARITAQLQHPSIVAVHEAGQWSTGVPFYVMPHVEGKTLSDALRETHTPEARLALVPHVLAAANAVAYAHQRRIIHRDIKPKNVMVGAFGETIVIDWGLAKDLSEPPELVTTADGAQPNPRDPHDDRPSRSAGNGAALAAKTEHGAVLGTPAYMAPEQARGNPVDERVDAYALGAILYEVLSGRPVYTGVDAKDVLAQVLRDPPLPLQVVAPSAPSDLVAIVAKAMARIPAERYPSARELADDLRRFQTGQLVAARRYSALARLRRFLARHRVVVGVVCVAVMVIIALSLASAQRIVRERDAAIAAREEADRQRGIADTRRARSEELVEYMLTTLKPQLARVGRLDVMQGVSGKIEAHYDSLAKADDQLDDSARGRRATALRMSSMTRATPPAQPARFARRCRLAPGPRTTRSWRPRGHGSGYRACSRRPTRRPLRWPSSTMRDMRLRG
jgi:hypothetical protein